MKFLTAFDTKTGDTFSCATLYMNGGNECIVLDVFYVLLTMHPGMILVNNQLDAQFFMCVFFSIFYMFRATTCPSSGELLYQCDTWFFFHPV